MWEEAGRGESTRTRNQFILELLDPERAGGEGKVWGAALGALCWSEAETTPPLPLLAPPLFPLT